MRKTHASVQVTVALLRNPRGRHWGYDLSRQAGIRSGVLYPILARMLDAGWLADAWEESPDAGKPPRRYYELTDQGRVALAAVLDEVADDPRFANLNRDRG